MNKKRCLLIINPISGTGNKRGLDALVTSRLADNGLTVETVSNAQPTATPPVWRAAPPRRVLTPS